MIQIVYRFIKLWGKSLPLSLYILINNSLQSTLIKLSLQTSKSPSLLIRLNPNLQESTVSLTSDFALFTLTLFPYSTGTLHCYAICVNIWWHWRWNCDIMGVVKAWRFSFISANLALLQQHNGNNKQFVLCRWRSYCLQRRKISWPLVCGLMLFALGLISLFTGHVASDLEWYSQRLVKPSLYSKLVKFLPFF